MLTLSRPTFSGLGIACFRLCVWQVAGEEEILILKPLLCVMLGALAGETRIERGTQKCYQILFVRADLWQVCFRFEDRRSPWELSSLMPAMSCPEHMPSGGPLSGDQIGNVLAQCGHRVQGPVRAWLACRRFLLVLWQKWGVHFAQSRLESCFLFVQDFILLHA